MQKRVVTTSEEGRVAYNPETGTRLVGCSSEMTQMQAEKLLPGYFVCR